MQTIKTSVLIIGTGGAGLRCAIELFRQKQKNILIVGDCNFCDAHTKVAEGGVNASFGNMENEPDNPLVHAVDTFHEGKYISNPYLVKLLTNHAQEAIDDLIDMGANFHKEPNEKISQRYFGAHTYRRTIFKGDETGQEIMRVLCEQVKNYKIARMNNLYIFKLLVENNHVLGAIGIQKNKFVIIEAPIVVIATGGYSNIYRVSSSRNFENFGDGIAMAFEAGAVVGDMEMVQFHPTGLVYPEEVVGELVTEAVRGEGGVLKNINGERFMERYSPVKMELSARDVVARANYMEILAGRGTKRGAVYLDITHRSKKFLLERLPKMYHLLKKHNNIDISKTSFEVAPIAHYTMGGIRFDPKTLCTNITGLYAVGESSMGVHGGNRLGGNSLIEILVFGKLIAKKIAKKKLKQHPVSSRQLSDFEEFVVKNITENGKLSSTKTLINIRNIMWEYVGIVRTQARLSKALELLSNIRKDIEKNGLADNETLQQTTIDKMRVHAVLDLAELVTTGALSRKESRGAHYREDYKVQKKVFLKNIFFQKEEKTIKTWTEKIPTLTKRFEKALKRIHPTTNYGHLE